MGQFASVDGTVRVVAVPGFHLSLTPGVVEVHKGDLDMVARFKVGVIRDAGFTKPVYLLVAGTSMGDFFLNDVPMAIEGKDYVIVGPGVGEVELRMDMTGQDIIEIPFSIGGFEDVPETVQL